MSERRYKFGDPVWVETGSHGRCRGVITSGWDTAAPMVDFVTDDFRMCGNAEFSLRDISPRDPEPANDHIAAPGKVIEPTHPHSHYFSGGMEAIDVIRAFCTPEEIRAWAKIASTLYLLRDGKKDGTNDVEKAHWHLAQALEARNAVD